MQSKNAKIIPLAICFIMFVERGLHLSSVPMHQPRVLQPAVLLCTRLTKTVSAMHCLLFKILVILKIPFNLSFIYNYDFSDATTQITILPTTTSTAMMPTTTSAAGNNAKHQKQCLSIKKIYYNHTEYNPLTH